MSSPTPGTPEGADDPCIQPAGGGSLSLPSPATRTAATFSWWPASTAGRGSEPPVRRARMPDPDPAAPAPRRTPAGEPPDERRLTAQEYAREITDALVATTPGPPPEQKIQEVRGVLLAAARLVEKGWSPDGAARNHRDEVVSLTDLTACAWSANGAIVRAADDTDEKYAHSKREEYGEDSTDYRGAYVHRDASTPRTDGSTRTNVIRRTRPSLSGIGIGADHAARPGSHMYQGAL